jgi:hypothetical protein
MDIPFGELEQGATLAFGSQEALEYAMKKSASFREVFADNARAAKAVDAETARLLNKHAAAPAGPKGMELLKRKDLPVQVRKPQIKKAGVYKVAMAAEDTTCIVADHVFGIDGRVRDGVMGVFELEGDRYYYASDPIFGEPVELDKTASFGDQPNGWGAFVLQKNGSIIATEPVRVWGRASMPGGIDKIAVESIHGIQEIHVSPNIKNWHMDGKDIYISPEWSFIPCAKMAKLGTYDPVQMEKDAGAQEKPRPRFGRSYPNLMKEAAFIQPLSGKWLPISSVDGAKLVKVALDVDDDEAKNTVDTMLGLNFITEENAYKFVDQIEKIGDAKEACAKLLLASRLGLPVAQEPLKTAMYALDNAERDLRQYSHTIMENEG